MDEPRESRITLQIGTDDGIFTVRLDDKGEGRLFSASLRGSPVRAIAVDPGDEGVLIAGCGGPGAGLYYSRDGGLTWEAPGMWPLGREVWALAFNPRDPRVVLAGTQPPAVYESKDRGYTWEELPGLQSLPCRESWTFPHPPHQAHIRRLAFNPAAPGTVLAGIEVGGVLRSGDGGRTWLTVHKGVDRDVHAVAFWPADTRVALAATGGGLFRCVQQCNGWRKVESPALARYVASLEVQQQAPWAIFTAGRSGQSALCRSDDGGATWTTLGKELPAPNLGVDALALNPGDMTTLYYGAQDPASPEQGCIFASDDGGESWRRLVMDVELPRIMRLVACGPLTIPWGI